MKDNLSYKHTEDGEVHPGEAIEEKISLSERFGLWISFYPFGQDEYLAIAAQWLRAGAGDGDTRRAEALVWALERGSRSAAAWRSSSRAIARGRHEPRSPTLPWACCVAAGSRFLLTSRPARQGLPRPLGVPGRQVRARRDADAGLATRTARGTGHHHGGHHALARRGDALSARHGAPALPGGARVARASSIAARASAWPGRPCPPASGRCCPARCRCCAGWPRNRASRAPRTGNSRRRRRSGWTGSWDERGLVPAIAQEAGSNDVLMFAWMNREALALTAERGQAVYFSRSRQRLWHKGEESGHFQQVHSIRSTATPTWCCSPSPSWATTPALPATPAATAASSRCCRAGSGSRQRRCCRTPPRSTTSHDRAPLPAHLAGPAGPPARRDREPPARAAATPPKAMSPACFPRAPTPS
jgi:phosphoribosyl-AMP cyclohydrolase